MNSLLTRNVLLLSILWLASALLLQGCGGKKNTESIAKGDILGMESDIAPFAPSKGAALKQASRSTESVRDREGGRPGMERAGSNLQTTALASLDALEKATKELRAEAHDCAALARVLKRIEAQSDLLSSLQPTGGVPLKGRGEKLASQLDLTFDELQPMLLECGRQEGFLRIMEGR